MNKKMKRHTEATEVRKEWQSKNDIENIQTEQQTATTKTRTPNMQIEKSKTNKPPKQGSNNRNIS